MLRRAGTLEHGLLWRGHALRCPLSRQLHGQVRSDRDLHPRLHQRFLAASRQRHDWLPLNSCRPIGARFSTVRLSRAEAPDTIR